MSKRKKRMRVRSIPAMIILGAGLILVGIAAFFAWPTTEKSALATDRERFSAVPVEVNYEAPSLALSDLDGRQHSLADYHGQVVLVNLWATWCPPCKAEMPTLEAYYDAHREEGFVTIAINDGDPESDVGVFVEEYGLTFPVWLDPTYEATERAFKTLNLPSSFVIDRKGNIRLRWVGEIDQVTLEKYVTPLILE